MAPETSQPFDVALHLGITGQVVKGSGDVVAAHLDHTPEQIAGVIEHDPRAASFPDQLRDQIRHAAVALREGLGVVVVPFAGVFKHVLEMRDQRSINASRDGGLVHVQGTGEA